MAYYFLLVSFNLVTHLTPLKSFIVKRRKGLAGDPLLPNIISLSGTSLLKVFTRVIRLHTDNLPLY